MAKRINLFRLKPKSSLPPLLMFFTSKGKNLGVVFSILFFIGFLTVNLLIFRDRTKIRQLNAQKEVYLKYLMDNKNTEAKFKYFKAKQKQLSDYYGNDASFLPYYQVLTDALKPASESAVLESVTINNKRDSTFTVKILNYDKAINFLKYVESDDFLNNFDELVLTGFNLFEKENGANDSSKGSSYQFSFKSSFKSINVSL